MHFSFTVLCIGISDVRTPAGLLRCHTVLLLASVDLPARALLLNMKQYNGKFSCCYCEEEGVPRASSHLHRNWPYHQHVSVRTQSSMRQNARETIDRHMSVRNYSDFQLFWLTKVNFFHLSPNSR